MRPRRLPPPRSPDKGALFVRPSPCFIRWAPALFSGRLEKIPGAKGAANRHATCEQCDEGNRPVSDIFCLGIPEDSLILGPPVRYILRDTDTAKTQAQTQAMAAIERTVSITHGSESEPCS